MSHSVESYNNNDDKYISISISKPWRKFLTVQHTESHRHCLSTSLPATFHKWFPTPPFSISKNKNKMANHVWIILFDSYILLLVQMYFVCTYNWKTWWKEWWFIVVYKATFLDLNICLAQHTVDIICIYCVFTTAAQPPADIFCRSQSRFVFIDWKNRRRFGRLFSSISPSCRWPLLPSKQYTPTRCDDEYLGETNSFQFPSRINCSDQISGLVYTAGSIQLKAACLHCLANITKRSQ